MASLRAFQFHNVLITKIPNCIRGLMSKISIKLKHFFREILFYCWPCEAKKNWILSDLFLHPFEVKYFKKKPSNLWLTLPWTLYSMRNKYRNHVNTEFDNFAGMCIFTIYFSHRICGQSGHGQVAKFIGDELTTFDEFWDETMWQRALTFIQWTSLCNPCSIFNIH